MTDIVLLYTEHGNANLIPMKIFKLGRQLPDKYSVFPR